MKKNGFTLIEILGVLILLGIISLITIPVFQSSLKASKQKLYDEQILEVKSGLKNWAYANIFLLPESKDTVTLSLGQLKQSGHASYEIKNPKNDKCFSNESLLTITKRNNGYIYNVQNMIDVDCDLIKDVPTIKINGDIVEYVKIGSTYNDLGATAKDYTGTDISSSIEKIISGSGNIDTFSKGSYTITYKVTDNGKTMIAVRTVIITDNI